MAEKTEKNPRGAGRKKKREPGKNYYVYIDDATMERLTPLIKETGSIGSAIGALVERKVEPPEALGELIALKRVVKTIKQTVDNVDVSN